MKEGVNGPPRDDVPRVDKIGHARRLIGVHVLNHGGKLVAIAVITGVTIHHTVPTQGGDTDVLEGLMVASSRWRFVNSDDVFVLVFPQRTFASGQPFGTPSFHLVGQIKRICANPLSEMEHASLVDNIT